MMKYAVIRIKGNQFKVTEGKEILVDKVGEEKIEPEVLLVADREKVTVGQPLVKGAKVTIKILAKEEKGNKIDILKYKAKSRYRRHFGFRSRYSRLLVEKISLLLL